MASGFKCWRQNVALRNSSIFDTKYHIWIPYCNTVSLLYTCIPTDIDQPMHVCVEESSISLYLLENLDIIGGCEQWEKYEIRRPRNRKKSGFLIHE